MFTKTETGRRLRVISALGKKANGIPTNSKAEVGLRTHQDEMHAATGVEAQESKMYIEGDDLYDFTTLDTTDEDLRKEGAVVHVYLYTRERPSDEWELYSVVVGWLGVKGQEPVLLDVDGKRVTLEHQHTWRTAFSGSFRQCTSCTAYQRL